MGQPGGGAGAAGSSLRQRRMAAGGAPAEQPAAALKPMGEQVQVCDKLVPWHSSYVHSC